jgi:hypothetical protein
MCSFLLLVLHAAAALVAAAVPEKGGDEQAGLTREPLLLVTVMTVTCCTMLHCVFKTASTGRSSPNPTTQRALKLFPKLDPTEPHPADTVIWLTWRMRCNVVYCW